MGFKADLRLGGFDYKIEFQKWEEIENGHLEIEWENADHEQDWEEIYPDASPEFINQLKENYPPDLTRDQWWPALAYANKHIGKVDVVELCAKVDSESIAKYVEEFDGPEDRRLAIEGAYETFMENAGDLQAIMYPIGEIFYSRETERAKMVTPEGKEVELDVAKRAFYNISGFEFDNAEQLEFNQLPEIQTAFEFFTNLIDAYRAKPIEDFYGKFDIAIIDPVNETITDGIQMNSQEDLEKFIDEFHKRAEEEENKDE